MKLNFNKILPAVLAGLMVGATAQAQETTSTTSSAAPALKSWSVGINAGTTAPISPLGGRNDYSYWKSGFGYGLYVKNQITPYFGLRLDATRGSLKGDNSEAFESGFVNNNGFQSFSTDLNYAVSLSAQVNMFNWSMFKKENNAQLFATVGAGIADYTTTTLSSANVTVENATETKMNIPVGVGAKFRLSSNVNLDLGWTVNFLDADNLDGVYRGGNDKWNYAYAGLEFALGNGPQKAFYSPTAATYDEAIAAKNTANALKSDLDAAKADNAKLRSEMSDLLKDSDGDGVADKLDKCPDTPTGTVVDGSGCPLKVPAPTTIEKVVVTEADRKVVNEAIKNLEFDLGKATIRSKSYASLNRVAALLVQKNFSLKLAGHTDITGSRELNLRLSKERAESVKAYLVSQGANASRIEATGYGPDQPIATNKTAAGRQKNRRVEFTLY